MLTNLTNLSRALRKTGALTFSERVGVSTLMHQIMLDEIGRGIVWRPGQVALQGGAALYYGFDSPRISNDLNLVLAEAHLGRVSLSGKTVLGRASRRIVAAIGGKAEYSTGVSPSRVDDGSDEQTVFNLSWHHPKRRGTVTIKAEFHPAPAEAVAAYKQTPVMMRMTMTPESGSAPLLVGNNISLWADKVVAIATRNEMKWRDIFDLGYLTTLQGIAQAGPEDRLAAIITAAGIHRLEMKTVNVGLKERALEIADRDLAKAEYLADLRRWFLPEALDGMQNSGLLEHCFNLGAEAIEDAMAIIPGRTTKRRAAKAPVLEETRS